MLATGRNEVTHSLIHAFIHSFSGMRTAREALKLVHDLELRKYVEVINGRKTSIRELRLRSRQTRPRAAVEMSEE